MCCRRNLTDSTGRLDSVDQELVDTNDRIETANNRIEAIKRNVDNLKLTAEELKHNATRIREMDIIGKGHLLTKNIYYVCPTATVCEMGCIKH